MGKVMVHFDIRGMSAKQYDQVWQDLRDAGFSNPDGLIYHAGAPSDKGWLVVDIWESPEKLEEFGKNLMPILQKNGVNAEQPSVFPIHFEYNG